ncbi:hypothetical protein PanWU01x14_285970 [Parasponia andersonii]|uniref:Uncharacterized protein n=1 Tax=Parasponia andersonii TaxID=3476 RepID=A0A2P5AZE3_PARAD|nr:hypothetical protein PanWU01x14_285970 [Parasponia andersonii]
MKKSDTYDKGNHDENELCNITAKEQEDNVAAPEKKMRIFLCLQSQDRFLHITVSVSMKPLIL